MAENLSFDAPHQQSLQLVAVQKNAVQKNTQGSLVEAQTLDSAFALESIASEIFFEYEPGESLYRDSAAESFLDKETLSSREQRIQRFFERKWRAPNATANEFAADIELLVSYYARHDVAVALIDRLARSPLRLSYQKNTFRTEVSGDQLRVRSVKILFDPHSAARVADVSNAHDAAHVHHERQVISSADALLHELIHADMALNQTARFLESGAMNTFVYPVQHEAEVIAHERALFAAMSGADNVFRPLRSSHAGELVASSCATCVR